MSFVSHYFSLLRSLRLPAVLVTVAAGGVFAFIYLDQSDRTDRSDDQLGQIERSVAGSPTRETNWPRLPPALDLDWSAFQAVSGSGNSSDSGFIDNFRFAGTFFLSGRNGADIRKAVLSIKSEGRQVIASVGDEVAGAVVTKITADSVELKSGSEVATLRLTLSSSAVDESSADADSAVSEHDESCRFGRLLAENSWELNRESLISYYNELLDEPERLLNVFDSLKPLYGEDNHINGYKLGIEGEAEFFKEMGLHEGDVIKKVNSLKMTSRARAEFFIKQFVVNKLSAIVIDVERDGKPKRLVYQVR